MAEDWWCLLIALAVSIGPDTGNFLPAWLIHESRIMTASFCSIFHLAVPPREQEQFAWASTCTQMQTYLCFDMGAPNPQVFCDQHGVLEAASCRHGILAVASVASPKIYSTTPEVSRRC